MSKKLLSLILAVAMVMSIFAIGFSTVAAADGETNPGTDGEETNTFTYYVLAPDNESTPAMWFWGLPAGQNAGDICKWDEKGDHFAMTAAPEVGKQVFSYALSADATGFLFADFKDGKQTRDLNKRGYKPAVNTDDEDDRAVCNYATTDEELSNFGKQLDIDNFNNMIFVCEDTNADGQFVGSWYSIDPEAKNYYRNSDAYKALNVQEIQSGTFFFKPDGEIFPLDGKYNFYIWNNNGKHFSKKNGWQDEDVWDSFPNIGGKKVETTDGSVLWESFEFTIDPEVPTFAIVQVNGEKIQTCDCVITVDAFGKTMVATGGKIENMEDSQQQANEARFEGTDKCGPAKGITSTCKVVGQVLDENADVNEMVAAKVNRYLGGSDWTYENVQKAIKDIGATPDAVWDAYEDLFGQNSTDDEMKAAKKVILGVEDEEETDDTADQGDKTESDDQGDKTESDDQGDKTESDDQGDKETDDQGDKETDDQGDSDTGKDSDTDPDKPDDGKTKKGLLGDVDGDGQITANDALLILRNSIGFKDTLNEALGDIDGDGKLTSNDALAVLRYTVDLKDDANAKVGTEVDYTVA